MDLIENSGRLVLVALLVIAVVSCQKELHGDDELVVVPPSKTCINCEYLPVCDSSKYVYVDSSATGIDSNVNIVRLLKDTSVNGVKYSGVTTLGFFDSGVFYNCDAQEYKVLFNASDLGLNTDSLLALLTQGLPISIPASSLPKPGLLRATILKANSPAATKWKDVLYSVNLIVINIEVAMESEMIAKSITRSVFSKSYTDVIEVKTNIGLTAGPAGTTNLTQLDIFYARGVGVIEARVSDNTGLQLVRKLYSRQTF